MTYAMHKKLYSVWTRWSQKRALALNPQQLTSSNIYILPSRLGWAFSLVLVTLFVCAINYQVSAVFFLTFLLALIGFMSSWEAHENLKGLSVRCVSIEDADEGAEIIITLSLSLERNSYAVFYRVADRPATKLEKLSRQGEHIKLYIPAKQRGCYSLPWITFSSYFPLGLFYVWGYVYFDAKYWIYPASRDPGFWPESTVTIGSRLTSIPGNEEIYDLKPVSEPWTQPGRIAWKIAARGQGWFIKSLVNVEGNYWLFQLDDLPHADIEKNLQHLSYWLRRAENEGYFYGLELRGIRTNLSQGPAHLTHCLRQLASY